MLIQKSENKKKFDTYVQKITSSFNIHIDRIVMKVQPHTV